MVVILGSTPFSYAGQKEVDLIRAAEKGRTRTVMALLKKGANVNAKDNHGYTALIKASEGGYLEVIKALLEKGAGVNAKSDSGSTSLLTASCNGRLDVVKVLLDKGADVNLAVQKNGWTPLMAASYHHNRVDIVRLLLERGADLEARDSSGETALMAAAFDGDPEAVKALLEKGANVNVKNLRGKTAVDIAKDDNSACSCFKSDCEKVVQLLNEALAKQNLTSQGRNE
ncbi:MAG: ankyrin repeat domain-containing protein [Candidatus Omnitrophota bacterium]